MLGTIRACIDVKQLASYEAMIADAGLTPNEREVHGYHLQQLLVYEAIAGLINTMNLSLYQCAVMAVSNLDVAINNSLINNVGPSCRQQHGR